MTKFFLYSVIILWNPLADTSGLVPFMLLSRAIMHFSTTTGVCQRLRSILISNSLAHTLATIANTESIHRPPPPQGSRGEKTTINEKTRKIFWEEIATMDGDNVIPGLWSSSFTKQTERGSRDRFPVYNFLTKRVGSQDS